MLYIGSFSYNDDTDDKDNFCIMPCVVEAADAEEAMGKFAQRFQDMRKNGDLLSGAREIYLDTLTELESVPSEPVVCQWQKIVPAVDGLCSITSALPDLDEDSTLASAYSWGDQEEVEEADLDDLYLDQDSEDFETEEPFLTF